MMSGSSSCVAPKVDVKLTAILLILASASVVSGCVSVDVQDSETVGSVPVCQKTTRTLGRAAVQLTTNWRPDQKDRQEREQMALRAVREAFSRTPCTETTEVWPTIESGALLDENENVRVARRGNFDTLMLVNVFELGPVLTLSVPVLWSSHTEVTLRLRVIDVASGQVIADVRRRRLVGGPFTLRGARLAEAEMVTVLKNLMGI